VPGWRPVPVQDGRTGTLYRHAGGRAESARS